MTKASQRRKREQKKQQSLRQQQMGLIFVVLAAVGIVAWIFFSTVQSSALDFEASTATGDMVRLSDYRGQVVMLNFWATWCPPCRAEMPAIQAAYAEYEDDGFVVLAINNRETALQVQQFGGSYGLSFPLVLDQDASLASQFAVRSFPTSIFLNAEGNAYATHSGALTPEQLEAYIADGFASSAGAESLQ